MEDRGIPCPFCGQRSVFVVPYEETVMFGAIPIKYTGTLYHCENPECPEPNRFSHDQIVERSRQREEQLAAIDKVQ